MLTIKKIFTVLIMHFIFLNVFSQGYLETQKINASDPSLASWFGYDVAIQGNVAVIGAKNTQIESNAMGSAYIFMKDTNGVWSEHQKLLAPDRRQFDSFGHTVAIDGDYIIIGALGQDYDINGNNFISAAGAAYIYKNDGSGNWIFEQKIIASDRTAIAYFGYSVDISGDQIVIGAGRDDYDINGENFLDQAGSAYIFEKDTNGTWNQVVKVTAPVRNTTDRFGYGVSIQGNYAAIGAYLEDEDENEANTQLSTGSVYVFKRDSNANWSFQQKLVAAVRPTSGESLGWSLDMDTEYIVAGAHKADDPGSSAGAVYIFKRDTNDTWSQVDKIIANDGVQGEWFGYDVAIQGDRVLVGAYQDYLITNGTQNTHGSLYYYLKETGADTWLFQQKVLASNWQDLDTHNYGISVDLDGEDVIVGDWVSDEVDPNTNESFNEAGSAFVLVFDENVNLSTTETIAVKPKAYPNPIKNSLNINLGKHHNTIIITVTSILGQHVFSGVFKNTDAIQLDFQEQAKGLYLVKVSDEHKLHTVLKVLKH